LFTVAVLPSAVRELERLSRPIQQRIRDHLDKLANDPRPPGSKLLKNGGGRMRIRVGDYRVIYRIENDALVVLVVKIGHRKDVYRNL
jgi:mRNA interferase RelE/StbE